MLSRTWDLFRDQGLKQYHVVENIYVHIIIQIHRITFLYLQEFFLLLDLSALPCFRPSFTIFTALSHRVNMFSASAKWEFNSRELLAQLTWLSCWLVGFIWHMLDILDWSVYCRLESQKCANCVICVNCDNCERQFAHKPFIYPTKRNQHWAGRTARTRLAAGRWYVPQDSTWTSTTLRGVQRCLIGKPVVTFGTVSYAGMSGIWTINGGQIPAVEGCIVLTLCRMQSSLMFDCHLQGFYTCEVWLITCHLHRRKRSSLISGVRCLPHSFN